MPQGPDEWIERAQQRLERLQEQIRKGVSPQSFPESLQELSNALEELRVASAEQQSQAAAVEEALQAAEREHSRYQHLFELAPDGYLASDGEGAITDANQAAARMLEYDAHELIGQPLAGFIAAPDRPAFRRLLARLRGGLLEGQHEMLVQPRHSPPFPVSLTISADTGAGDQHHRLRWLLRDIREQRRMEEELLRSRHYESLAAIAGGLAHDLNNYLGGIVGSLTLARRQLEQGSAKAADTMQLAESAALGARRLSEQLLTFAKGGAPVRQRAAIGEVIRESAAFARRGSQASPEVHIADELWPVEADLRQLNQALTNVVLNAAQAMPQGGTVRIEATNVALTNTDQLPLPAGRYVRISVSDQGEGISPEILPRIFDPYYSTRDRSAGLGLPITYSIVKRHQGHVDVKSEPGHGTTVTLYLSASVKPAREQPAGEGPAGGGRRVLFVDDEYMVRMPFATLLEMQGYQVDHADSGEQAVSRYRHAKESGRPYDAIIMDLTMPGGIGGREATRRILEIDPTARVVVASGYSGDAAMAHYREHGFKAAVAKPYTAEGLANALAAALAEEEEKQPA